MSLKDRLNSGIKTIKTQEEQKQIPKKQVGSVNLQTNINILDALLIDENINSISITGAKNVYIERKGKIIKSSVSFRDNIQLTNLIMNLAQEAGIEEDKLSSYMNFTPKPGLNVKALLPPISSVPSLYIKCYHDKIANIRNFQEEGIISKEISLVFEALALIRQNIIIAGDRNTFKTAVLSSILKLIPITNRGVVFDDLNELKTNSNCVSYNLSSIDNKARYEIINAVSDSNPEKIAINDGTKEKLSYFIKALFKGYKGLITTIEATTKEEALEKISRLILKINPQKSYEEAKRVAYNMFDILIFCSKDEEGKRKISSISEIESCNADNFIIKDIFVLNKQENDEEIHSSTGVVPKICEFAKNNAIPINPNIFVNDYKHTYSTVAVSETANKIAKNIDILSKFKKELNQNFDNKNYQPSSDTIKKAQEKFQELKKNARNQEQEIIEQFVSEENVSMGATIQDIDNSLNNTENK